MNAIISIIVILVVLGIAFYFLSPYIAEPFRTIIIVLVILAVCIWLLMAFGIWSPKLGLNPPNTPTLISNRFTF
jgi:hypothetical protein